MKTRQKEQAPLGLARSKLLELIEAVFKEHLNMLLLSTAEQTLNLLLEHKPTGCSKRGHDERTQEPADTPVGSYRRKLQTQAGAVRLKVPKLHSLPFETAIIERYKRRHTSVGEALLETYLGCVSVRRIEDIIEVLWGTKVIPSTVSGLN